MPLVANQSVAIFDIGSNAVRLTGYRILPDGSAEQILKKRELCEMGRAHDRPNYLYPAGVARAHKTIAHYCDLIRDPKYNFAGVVAVATEAARRAHDGRDFIAQIHATNHLSVTILDEAEEGRLGAAGVLRETPDACGIVADLGGGSMQMTRVADGTTHETKSFQLGGLRLLAAADHLDDYIDQHLVDLPEPLQGCDDLYVIGSWRGFAELYQQRAGIKDRDLEGVRMDPGMIAALTDWLFHEPPHVMQQILTQEYGFEDSRAELLPYGAHLLRRLVNMLGTKNVIVSSSRIRDGLLQAVIDGKIPLQPLPHKSTATAPKETPVASGPQTA